jgi:Na+-transporting NADH:ubiquinone oxidoreductase subunit C
VISFNPLHWWRLFLHLPNSNSFKVFGIALLVALTSSFVVALTAVTLKPLHEANRLRESAASLVEVVEALGLDMPRARLIDLASGAYVAQDPGTWIELDADRDTAGLGKLETVVRVYELHREGRLELVVLPVRGGGHQSMMKGYLALRGDLDTIAALTFHEQNETPGMGARIAEKSWQALWFGKRVADADGTIRIRVARGKGVGDHEVDGISGATHTVTGINNLLRFWLGPNGFGPYLAHLKSESGL